MDCTLREGPYEHRFDNAAMTGISRGLADAGVRLIEAGAETGLGTQPDIDDVAQLRMLSSAVPEADFGVIVASAVSTADDLRKIVDAGARFLRIASAVTRSELSLPLLEAARDLGVFVTYNAIKCYAVDIPELIEVSKRVVAAGAQVVYLVDSAGAMLPREVRARTLALREADINVGFHGHDNLGLAAANSLAALDAGATLIDGTLRGIGRSAGNAQIEAVVKAGQKDQRFADVDSDELCRLGAVQVAPHRLRDRGIDHLDLAMGEGQFHSDGLALAQEVAREHGLALEQLVREAGLRDPIAPDLALLQRTAKALREAQSASLASTHRR